MRDKKKTKTNENFTFNKRILNKFKFKLEKFLQLREGCMIMMNSTNMDSYQHSSVTRDVFDKTP
jgi:hypothetical protein